MTPDNDKTLRGLFHEHTIGLNEWNDRRDYRIKYEKTFNNSIRMSSKFSFGEFEDIFNFMKVDTIVHDKYNVNGEEENYISRVLERFFPESKLVEDYYNMASLGFYSVNGHASCDRCGANVNVLNRPSVYHGLCDECDSIIDPNKPYYEDSFEIR